MTMNVQIASTTPAADMGVNKNFDKVLNITIQTASLTDDSPYLQMWNSQMTYTIIFKLGSTERALKRERVALGLNEEINAPKIMHSTMDQSVSPKK